MFGVQSFNFFVVATLLLSSLLLGITAQDACVTSSRPNPIAQQYPANVTGTLNTTLAIVPIPMAQARSIIPAKYAILEGAYRALLPDFPADMYPVLMQAGLDHDIQLPSYNIFVPDFQRVGWSFPFVDLLGDGYSSFTWAPAQMLSSNAEMAINGSRDYGTVVYPSTFMPGCDAYTRGDNSSNNNNNNEDDDVASSLFMGNATDDSGMYFSLDFSALAGGGAASPFPVAAFQNMTNQPVFANGTACNRQVRLFNSTMNQGQLAPVPVKGTITSNLPPMDASQGVKDVYGLLIDTPFIESHLEDCQGLQGYSGI